MQVVVVVVVLVEVPNEVPLLLPSSSSSGSRSHHNTSRCANSSHEDSSCMAILVEVSVFRVVVFIDVVVVIVVVAIMVAIAPGHCCTKTAYCATRSSYPESQNWRGTADFPVALRQDAEICERDVMTLASTHARQCRERNQLPAAADMIKFSVLCSFASLVAKGCPVKRLLLPFM